MTKFLLSALALSTLVACGSSGGSTLESATCPPGNTLTYSNFGKGFVDSYCIGCHSSAANQGGISLEGEGNIGKVKSKMYAEAAASNSEMPPAGKKAPTADERTKLGEWLACGAK
jgi:uncharacterized membrane protein